MKKRKLWIAAALAAVSMLAACKNTNTEVNMEQLPDGSDEAKDKVTDDTSERAEKETDEHPDAEDGFEPDLSQSFEVTLNPLGAITFQSFVPKDAADGEDAYFTIEKDGVVQQELKNPYTAVTVLFDKIDAVAFSDYNGDGYEDIIIIASYMAAGGPETPTGWQNIRYYEGSSAGRFAFDEPLSRQANGMIKDFSVASAKEFAQINAENGINDNGLTDNVYREKYKQALQTLVNDFVYPNGSAVDMSFIEEQDFSENQFAICDMDGDGIEELVISYGDASMAGMAYYVFQYEPESDSFREEIAVWPGVEVYDNGFITVQASHNHGKSGEFWPYAIYEYDPASDTYVLKYAMDAWEKKTFPTDADGNLFPDETDVSGSGYVYYIHEGGYDENTAPSDKTEYDKIVEHTYGSADAVQIDYTSITKEHIADIH